MIELKNIERNYKTGAGFTWVLRRVNLDIQQGEFITVMGPSGAGKSSLLNVLALLDDQWTGEYWFREQAVHEMNIFCWMLKSHPLSAAGLGGINALKGVPPGRTIMDHYAVTYQFPDDITIAYSHCVYTPSGFGGLYQAVYGSEGRGTILEDTLRLSLTKDGKRTPVEVPPLRDASELAIQSFAKCIREGKEPLSNVDAGRNATLMAILGRTAIHERRVAEWKELDL